jgi:type VI secretion system protein ImpE
MDANALFDAGRLSEAIAAQTQDVKSKPADVGKRTFLFELLCFAGDLDRAAKQLDVIAEQSVEAEAAAQVYRNILQAERARRRLLADGLRPNFLADPPEGVHHCLEAVNRLRENNLAEAARELDAAEEARPERPGRLNDEVDFDDFRDCDDLFGSVLELFVGPDYHWVPTQQIAFLQVAAPERPRDLLWAACQVNLTDGTPHRGYLPVLYPNSHEHENEQVKLGRMTDWKESDDGPVLGVGQRMLIIGDDARAVLDLRSVEFSEE